MSNTPNPVFLGCITHDGRIDMTTAKMLFSDASTKYPVYTRIEQSSLLAKNCNEMWTEALNLRSKYNFKWFCMLHSDVRPEANFIDKMIDLAEQHEIDLLSVALPIKDERGLTSTAISHKNNPWLTAGRITQTQLKKLPPFFDADQVKATLGDEFDNAGNYLLANTGLMICRLDKPWSEQLYFTINDAIVKNIDGRFETNVMPEDWHFTSLAARLGARVMVTSAISATHVGSMAYNNQAVWGKKIDQ